MTKQKMNQNDIARNNFVASCFLVPNFLHSHEFFEISFGVCGQSINIINNAPYLFEKGKCAILRPSDQHYFKEKSKSKSQYEHRDIYVTEQRFLEICNTIHPDLYTKIISNKAPICFDISQEFFEFVWQKSLLLSEAIQNKNQYFQALHTTIITTVLNQWLEKEVFTQTKYPEWIANLLPLFNSADFLALSVSDIAKSVGYSLPYFSSEFKKYMKISALKYLNSKRLIFSKQLLLENRMNIIDVATLLGYANPSTYSKHFREEFGITPSEYRNKKS